MQVKKPLKKRKTKSYSLVCVCRYPSSGSFIRFQPNKVLLGQTFMQALKDKYLAEQEENTVAYDKAADKGEVYLGGNKQIVVETYGFEKVQRTMR